jgi:error-prone DNA polymerase
MKDIEKKLRAGMQRTGIEPETQDKIVKAITSFALYGFPESHAASFALLAYASAYLKCHYLAAFTAALLNNQPMGFYQPATIVKDAQRHGLKILPIDVTCSDWLCTLEKSDSAGVSPAVAGASRSRAVRQGFTLRLGLRYAKGLREEMGLKIVQERAARKFSSVQDLKLRIPAIQKSELAVLAEIGALNFIAKEKSEMHRRDALWQIERAARQAGPLLEELAEFSFPTENSPLSPMNPEERLVADFRGTGMTIGLHPMAYKRLQLKQEGIRSVADLHHLRNGMNVRIAGAVIARQRPGTANGFVFLSLEDETGITNAIITPQLFEEDYATVVQQQFLLIEGKLQNQEGVISVKAERVQPLPITQAETASHDFH